MPVTTIQMTSRKIKGLMLLNYLVGGFFGVFGFIGVAVGDEGHPLVAFSLFIFCLCVCFHYVLKFMRWFLHG